MSEIQIYYDNRRHPVTELSLADELTATGRYFAKPHVFQFMPTPNATPVPIKQVVIGEPPFVAAQIYTSDHFVPESDLAKLRSRSEVLRSTPEEKALIDAANARIDLLGYGERTFVKLDDGGAAGFDDHIDPRSRKIRRIAIAISRLVDGVPFDNVNGGIIRPRRFYFFE